MSRQPLPSCSSLSIGRCVDEPDVDYGQGSSDSHGVKIADGVRRDAQRLLSNAVQSTDAAIVPVRNLEIELTQWGEPRK